MLPEESNPWQTLETQIIYENPWIKVEEDKVINPAGNPSIYGRVHFKNKAIGIIPLDENNNTWLVGQFRYSLNEYSWEIPMGGGPHDETPLEAGKRELQEETGLLAEKWQNIMRIHTSNSVTDEVGYVFIAQQLSQVSSNPDEEEALRIKKIPLEEAFQLVIDQTITDAISVAGILKTYHLVKEGKL